MELVTIENITLFLALWGAGLSTYKVISDHRKSVRKLKVNITFGFRIKRRSTGPSVVILSAINMRNRDVTLNSMGFILPDKRYLLIVEPQSNVSFPYTLNEGKECSVWQTQKEFAEELETYGFSGKIKLKGYFKSATGKTYESKKISFNTESIME